MTDKNKIVDDVYKHPILGYGSIKSAYKEAKSSNNEITLNDVKEYFAKLPSKQNQFKYKGYNSFVASEFVDQNYNLI